MTNDSASAPPALSTGAGGDWRDDPSADERWNAGLDFGMEQLCAKLGVDPQEVSWDAATETLDGDVQAVIGNVLTQWAGDDWRDAPARVSPAPAPGDAGDLAGQSAPALIAWLAHRRDECYASEVKFPAESPTSDWHRAKGDAFAEAHIYALARMKDALARMKDAPRPAGDLAGQGEPVAWAYEEIKTRTFDAWEPALSYGQPELASYHRNIRPLYEAPAPSRTAVTEATDHA